MSDRLYSIRMRASSSDGRHISGAERIVPESEVASVSSELIERAMEHERGRPDSIAVNTDAIDETRLVRMKALTVHNHVFDELVEGHIMVSDALYDAGIGDKACANILERIYSIGFSSQPGAVLVDAFTCDVLKIKGRKSVRARMIDYDPTSLPELDSFLEENSLGGTHFREALALATKVAHAPGIIAELCISDDPSYVTGYVASLKTGYIRITPVKRAGDSWGGRVWFVDPEGLDEGGLMEYLRSVPVLVTGPFVIKS